MFGWSVSVSDKNNNQWLCLIFKIFDVSNNANKFVNEIYLSTLQHSTWLKARSLHYSTAPGSGPGKEVYTTSQHLAQGQEKKSTLHHSTWLRARKRSLNYSTAPGSGPGKEVYTTAQYLAQGQEKTSTLQHSTWLRARYHGAQFKPKRLNLI